MFIVDFGKGLVAVLLARAIAQQCGLAAFATDLCMAIGGMFSVVGHSYPVWLGFKGGKGVATSLGVIFGFSWIAAAIALIVWILTFKTTRYVSVASIIAAIALPVTMMVLLFRQQLRSPVLVYFSACLTLIVIVRHRSNISRLFSGTETRFAKK